MFHWDRGLKLTKADLAIDFRRRQPRAFISHAHADHMARHEYAICTPETVALYQHRLGQRSVLELPYRKPIDWGGLRLTTYPAGHCLGSAMLLAEDGDNSLLYTGDFKLGPSATSQQAEFPNARTLIIETTYGKPQYRLPPREESIAKLVKLVRQTIDDGAVPVIIAYALGKSQEVTRILTDHGVRVVQHDSIYKISKIYEEFGVDLGGPELYADRVQTGAALIIPPRAPTANSGPQLVRFVVTGWAIDTSTKFRWRADHAIPLSDHADYDELFEAVRRVSPEVVYCTHGPESFVDRLYEAGIDARQLGRRNQGRLF